MALIKDTTPAQAVEQEKAPETVTLSQDQRQELLRRVSEAEKKIWSNTAEDVKKAQEKYAWPLSAALKIFDWQAVVAYESYKKDSQYDWVYKNEKWEFIDNHMLKVTLADWSVNKVTRNAFDLNHTKGEQIPFWAKLKDWTVFKEITQKRLVAEYDNIDVLLFNYNWQDLEVKPTFIN